MVELQLESTEIGEKKVSAYVSIGLLVLKNIDSWRKVYE